MDNVTQARAIARIRYHEGAILLASRVMAAWKVVVVERKQHEQLLYTTSMAHWRDSILRKFFHVWSWTMQTNVRESVAREKSHMAQKNLTDRFLSFLVVSRGIRVAKVLQQLTLRGWSQVARHSLEMQERNLQFRKYEQRVCWHRNRRLLRLTLDTWLEKIDRLNSFRTQWGRLFARVNTRRAANVLKVWKIYTDVRFDCERRWRLKRFADLSRDKFHSLFVGWRKQVLTTKMVEHEIRLQKVETTLKAEYECRQVVERQKFVQAGRRFLEEREFSRTLLLAERMFFEWRRLAQRRSLRARVDYIEEFLMSIRVFYAWRDQIPLKISKNFGSDMNAHGEMSVTRRDAKVCAVAIRKETEKVRSEKEEVRMQLATVLNRMRALAD